MDIWLSVDKEQYDRIKDLDTHLGMILWNLAVMVAPIDTGNLRRAISLAKNNRKNIRIQYNLLNANYIKFLEYGYGPVKKYKGFISNLTVSIFIETIINFIKVGNIDKGLLALPPLVVLNKAQSVFNQEGKVAKMLNIGKRGLTANQRRQISRYRERVWQESVGSKPTSSVGRKVETTTHSKMAQALTGKTVIGGLK